MDENEPAIQAVQMMDETDDQVPVLQLRQAVMLVAPGLADHCPAGQLTQEDADGNDQVPALQILQLAALATDQVPALQLEQDEDKDDDHVPAPQIEQLVDPARAKNPA